MQTAHVTVETEIQSLRNSQDAIQEMNALNLVAQSLSNQSLKRQAVRLVKKAYIARLSLPDCFSIENRIILCAMTHILDLPSQNEIWAESSTWEKVVLSTTAQVWRDWLHRGQVDPDTLSNLRSNQTDHAVKPSENLLTLNLWTAAVESLVNDEPRDAKSRWEMALRFARDLHTDCNLVISWTYVASFFR